jgi:hypothetical protein
MIKISDIIRAIADAIDNSGDVRAVADRYKLGLRLIVGHLAEGDMQADDHRAVIAVGFAPTEYDLGYVAERVAPIAVRVLCWDKDAAVDGVREDYIGALAASDLCHEIAEAVRGIAGLGDDLLSAGVTMDSSGWPLTVGTIALSVQWPVALNSEATL